MIVLPTTTELAQNVNASSNSSTSGLVLLEQLQPLERAVFLLREVFEYEYAEIASFLGKSEAACRRSFSRARTIAWRWRKSTVNRL